MKHLDYKDDFEYGIKHPSISQVQIINKKNNFPISWLNSLDYCEYSLYLEKFKHVKVPTSKAMRKGTNIHNKLEEDFIKKAEVTTLEKLYEQSKTKEVVSREFFVFSERYGIRGFIDEIWVMPDKIVIIDDKPGNKAYQSMKNQVYAYALAYIDYLDDDRKIICGLRTRGTDNIFWQHEFDENSKAVIIKKINHMHRLIQEVDDFKSSKNPNKCYSCRFKNVCSRSLVK